MNEEKRTPADLIAELDREPDIVEPSIQAVRDAIGILFRPGQVVELRSFGVRGAAAQKFVLSGYYDDPCKMAADAVEYVVHLGRNRDLLDNSRN